MKNQITVRDFGQQLEMKLHELARERGMSLNKAAALLMRKGAGLPEPGAGPERIGDSLDHFIGSWAKDEAFLDSIRETDAANM